MLALQPAMAATINVASMSRTDMTNAIAQASAGDTLVFPAGSANYSSTVTLTKPLKMLFADGSSIVTNTSGGENTWVLSIDTETDSPIRISGLTIQGNGDSSGIFVGRWQNNVRIDHCYFSNNRRHGIQFVGFEAYGVVDHCRFTNCYTAFENNGNDGQSWDQAQTPFGLGTTNCVTLEDCYFENNDDTLVSDLNNVIYVSNGGRVLLRNSHARGLTTVQSFSFWDSHGNNSQEPFSGGSLRGTVWAVIHSNIVDSSSESDFRHFYLRGGMHVLSSNIISGNAGSAIFALTEEECWADFSYPIQDTIWPASDQITNTWIAANTYNGSPVTDSNITNHFGSHYYPGNENDRTFIQLNRDYFVTNSAANIPAFSTNGHPSISDGMYGVDWLVYPHPRITADSGGGAPEPVNRLRVTGESLVKGKVQVR